MRLFPILTFLILLFGTLAADSLAPLTPAETGQLVQMLEHAGFDSLSFNFEKDWDLSTKYKLDWQLRQLQQPWQALEDLAELRKVCAPGTDGQSVAPGLLKALGCIAGNLDPAEFSQAYESNRKLYERSFGFNINRPEDIPAWFEGHLAELEPRLEESFAALDAKERECVLSFWLWQFIESEDTDEYADFYSRKGLPAYGDLDAESVRNSLGKIDAARLLETGIRFLALGDVLAEKSASLEFCQTKPLVRKTTYGLMVIGTRGNDVYDSKTLSGKPVCLLLEPGGNDVYAADISAWNGHGFSLAIDLEGDDVYRSAEPAEMFCGAFGLAFSYDLRGDDLYQTDDFSFASCAGLSMHQDTSGDDIYRSGLFSQAAAFFGVAAMVDGGGNDSYSATASAQAIGGTRGAGALLDLAGSDNYLIGGKYFHEPLMPLDYITLGQGMGLGLRPDLAGGLGLLYDRSGNDRYLGGVYAQGSGYWFATGALIDESGNDVYNTVYYPQGSGIHLANGLLFDGAGDDAYYSRNGPGQGAAHDWGTAWFIDGAGNDAYSIPGGNGLALTNSVAVFVDKSGDDRYERKEVQNYGSANFSRSTGGLGLFLDAGGKDVYPDTLQANDKTWQRGTYGIGRDVEMNTVAKTEIEELAAAAALPDSTDSIEDIFAAASEWEVGSAVQRVRAARAILVARAKEAIPYVIKHKIGTDSGLEYRALEELVKNSPDFAGELRPLIFGSDSLAAKNAMSLLAGVGDSLLVEYVERLMAQSKYETACLSVLSGVNTPRAVELLRGYIDHPSERFRYITARSLLQNRNPAARETLMLMSSDPSFLVQALLRNMPPEAQP